MAKKLGIRILEGNRGSMDDIRVEDIEGFSIGIADDAEAGTGVTVIVCKDGAATGLDVSGGGPASRETLLTDDLSADNPIHAVVLSGGSAFGLAASDGVMRCLEERGIGYDTGTAIVPLVVGSCIFDLAYKRADLRPDAQMGYVACEDAFASKVLPSGSHGAGCGATVGKLAGMERCMKSGMGTAAVQIGELKVAAVVVVNAIGDIFDCETGEELAGMRGEDGSGFVSSEEMLYAMFTPGDLFAASDVAANDADVPAPLPNANTTIGVILTNGSFTRAEMNKIASMARCAYARCINPVGTTADGDSIYAMSHGDVPADLNVVGTLAARVMARAIRDAVTSAQAEAAVAVNADSHTSTASGS